MKSFFQFLFEERWDAHKEAIRIVKKLEDMDYDVPVNSGTGVKINFSTNRNNDKSAYFTVIGSNKNKFMDVRVSDHYSNPDYQTTHANIISKHDEDLFFEYIKTALN